MRSREVPIVTAVASLTVLASTAAADNLAGSARLLCSSWHAARCTADGACEATESWRLNMPDFVELDLNGKVISTTAAHSEARNTPIDVVRRENGLILLHGQQGNRAWSWVINEQSGEGTLAISAEGDGITVFSACTPIERLVGERSSEAEEPPAAWEERQ